MATNVQYNFPYKNKTQAIKEFEDAIPGYIESAIKQLTPGDSLDEFVFKTIDLWTPITNITEQTVKIAVNPEDYGIAEITAGISTIVIKEIADKIKNRAIDEILKRFPNNENQQYILGLAIESLSKNGVVAQIANIDLYETLKTGFDYLAGGTFDAELRLIDQDGNLLGGGFYIDGLKPENGEVHQAIQGLLQYADSRTDVPRIEEGSQIAFSRPQIDSNTAIYTVYDGEIVSQIAETTGKR